MDRHTLERELETLADALPFLLARDDERPARWLSPAFGEHVARVRSRVATIVDGHRLAVSLDAAADEAEVGRFERAARRLSIDANAVALAIRWLEIQADTRLPSWAELLRRGVPLEPLPTTAADAGFMFG